MTPEVSIIVVTYESAELIDECLASFFADPLIDRCEVIVVDNDSTDGGAQRAVEREPRARLVLTGRNAGFGAGNNVGIQMSRAPWVLIANPDTRLRSGGLAGLIDFMAAHPRAGLAGPRLLNDDLSLQHSIRNYPTVAREAVESLLLHRILPRLRGRFTHTVEEPGAYAAARTVDWVSGAVMFARTEAVRSVGGFDEGFFLYSEEVDLCRRLELAGWETWYTPSVEFLHIGGENDASVALGLETQRSKLRYFLKHQGRARMLLVAGAVVTRLLVRSVVWLVPAALERDGGWRARLRTGAHVLRRYPGMVARSLFSRAPTTVSAMTRAVQQ